MRVNSYWVYTHTTPDGFVYVGMSGQKYTSGRWKSGCYYENSLIKKEIERWGWENITHSVIKDGLTKQEAQQLEEEIRQFNETNGVSLNKIKSGGITKSIKEYEHNRNNIDSERIEYKREWQIKHREEHNRQNREYYQRKKLKKRESRLDSLFIFSIFRKPCLSSFPSNP